MVKQNIFTLIDRGIKHLDVKLKRARRCPFCGTYEFNIQGYIMDWLYHPSRAYDLSNEEKMILLGEIQNRYKNKLTVEIGDFSTHHISYVMDITMPVCRSCHKKIHYGKEEPWIKYKPIDKKGDPKLYEKPLTKE